MNHKVANEEAKKIFLESFRALFMEAARSLDEKLDFVIKAPRMEKTAKDAAAKFKEELARSREGVDRAIGQEGAGSRTFLEERLNRIKKIDEEMDGYISEETGKRMNELGSVVDGIAKKGADWMKTDAEAIRRSMVEEYGRLEEAGFPFSRTKVFYEGLCEALQRLEEYAELMEYDGPRLEKSTIAIAGYLVDWVRKSKHESFDMALDSFVDFYNRHIRKRENLPKLDRERAKELMVEVAYAVIPYSQTQRINYLKIPKSYRDRVRAIDYSIRMKLLDQEACKEAAEVFLSDQSEHYIYKLYNAYGLEGEGVKESLESFLNYAYEIIDIRATALRAHPVKAHSSFKQILGRITKYESPTVKFYTPASQLDDVRRDLMEYNLLKIRSLWHYEKARAMLLGLCERYKESLSEDDRRMLRELAIVDLRTGEPVIIENSEQQYLESLEKTLKRWNDLGKEFRKIPYDLEDALKRRYGKVDESELRSEFERTLHKVEEELKAAKAAYAKSMEIKERITALQKGEG